MLKKLGKRGIEMEMVVKNKFLEMNEKEMMDVDGGIVFTATGLAWVAKKVGVVGVSKIIVGTMGSAGLATDVARGIAAP